VNPGSDRPGFAIRGVIEGFYGPPWTHAERLDLLRFCGRHGLNTWVHAPKDDPYHRKLWREPYPAEELERLAELAAVAEREGVEFAWAVAPGLSIRYSDERELAALLAKCEHVRSAGVTRFQLLWDDIERELRHPADSARYGGDASPSAAAHAELSNSFLRDLPGAEPLVVCPMGYAGVGPTPYRDTLARALDPDIVVYWTGPEVVPQAITRDELDAAAHAFGHELLLWDNYPVNDFDPGRLFLGPLLGREPRLHGGRLAGLVANGMLQAVPCKLPLATVADFARDPHAYDPAASLERALREHGAEVAAALRALAPGPVAAGVPPPADVPALLEALAPGVDAATALVLLQPFV
jgi:hyaluronoglucosaminidase